MKKIVVALLCLTTTGVFRACLFGTLAKIKMQEKKETITKDQEGDVPSAEKTGTKPYNSPLNSWKSLIGDSMPPNNWIKWGNDGWQEATRPLFTPVFVNGELKFVEISSEIKNKEEIESRMAALSSKNY